MNWAEEATQEYFFTYFTKRDYSGVKKFFGENLSGFGTGLHEVAYSRKDSEVLFKEDIESLPEPIHWEVLEKKFLPITEETTVVMAVLKLSFWVGTDHYQLADTRQTLVMKKSDAGVTVEHLHVSFPGEAQISGEAYPLTEIRLLTDNLESLVREKTKSLEQAYRELEKALITDRLTGLLSRGRVEDLIQTECLRAERYNTGFCVLMADLDNFKLVNDTYGHLEGDSILIKTAEILKKVLRATDGVGRWGGDEFIVFLPQTSLDEALKLGETICREITTSKNLRKKEITISIGVSQWEPGKSMQNLIHLADQGLYRVKRNLKNGVSV